MEPIPRESSPPPELPQTLDRTPSTNTPYGSEYEYKLAGLLALRARNKGLRFRIWTNAAAANPSDDIVLRVLEGPTTTPVIVFMQLKHANESGKKVDIQAFTSPTGDFSLKKYFRFFVDFANKHSTRESLKNEDEVLLHDCALEDVRLVLYTNKTVTRKKGATDAPHLSFPHEDLLYTSKPFNSRSIFSFGEADTDVWDLNVGDSEKSLYQRDFLPRLRVFSEQAHADELDGLIKEEMNLIFGASFPRIEQYVSEYISLLRKWALNRTEKQDLRRFSGEVESIIFKDLAKHARIAAGMGTLVFQKENCWNLRKLMYKNRTNTHHVTVPGVLPGHRAAKLLQVLDEDFPTLWTYVGDQALREFPLAALEAACGACDVLVLDVEEELVRGRDLFAAVGSRLQVVVVTSRGDANPLEDMAPRWEALEEDWRLSHLTPEAQEKMMDATILFQGRRLKLHALEVTWPALREEVDGALLSALVRGKGAVLGVAPPAPDGAKMYLPRTLEHPALLSLDVLTQVDPLTDHLVLSGFPPALLEQMTIDSTAQPVGEMSEHEDREDGEQPETVEDDRTDEIRRQQNLRNKRRNKRWTVLPYENEEDSYKDVCKKNPELNVHWLQCHGNGEELDVGELRVIWKRTEGSELAVAPFVLPASDACSRAPKCVHATHAVRDAAAWRAKTGLLIGEPGIGKTQFLQRLAAEARERAPGRWAVMLQVQEHCEFLKELPDPKELKTEHVVKLLAAAAAATGSSVGEASRRCLDAALFQTGAIVVFIDGVDEVCPAFKDKLMRLLELLLEMRVQLVWVSSRPQVEDRLRQVLRCQTSSLYPFSKAEQKNYLCNYWSSLFNREARVFKGIADEFVDELQSTSQREQKRSLLDVPQHIVMAAEVVESFVDAALKARNNLSSNVDTDISLCELYKRFVEKKKDLYRQRFGLANAHFENIPVTDKFDKIHQNCAMIILISDGAFDSIDLSPLRSYIKKNKNYLLKEKTGVLWLREDETPYFAHYSFVEFFAASWMFSHPNHPTTEAVYQSLETEKGHNRVLVFLDQMLAEGLPVHEAVLLRRPEAFYAELETCDLNKTDCFGRLALHLAAARGPDDAVRELISKSSHVSRRDTLLRWTPLKYAAVNLRLEEIELLLSARADFCEVSLDKNTIKTLLFLSVDKGHPNIVRGILRSQSRETAFELCRTVREEMTLDNRLQSESLLHRAARRRQDAVMEILLEHGADVNAVNSMKETPLMLAVRSSSVSTVKVLLQHKADLHASSRMGTALHWAARNDYHLIEHRLLRNRADVNALIGYENKEQLFEDDADISGSNGSATHSIWFVQRGAQENVLTVLLDNGADINVQNEELETALILAARNGNESCVWLLLKHGADVHAKDIKERTALHWAAESGRYVILRLLLERGAIVDAECDQKYTPLMLAIWNKEYHFDKNESRVRLLLTHKANVHACDVNKWTPLHFASWRGNCEILKLLVEHGADINAVNILKETPLILAVGKIKETRLRYSESRNLNFTVEPAHFKVLNFLVEKGADVNRVNMSNETALIIAVKCGLLLTSICLEKYGADVNSKDTNHRTALHFAVDGDCPEIVEFLLENRANVNECNSSNETPLTIAVKRGNEEIVQLLLQHGADVEATDSNGKTPLDWATDGGNGQILNLLYEQILRPLERSMEAITNWNYVNSRDL